MQELHKDIDNVGRLFTVFCRYDDTVAVSQFRASDPKDAVRKWIELELQTIPDQFDKSALETELRADSPGLVQGCRSVWVVTAFPIWLDIVLTDESLGG